MVFILNAWSPNMGVISMWSTKHKPMSYAGVSYFIVERQFKPLLVCDKKKQF